jgi:Holliday junction resolvase RusA-like endonuclease
MIKIELDNFKCPSLNSIYVQRHWSIRKRAMDEIHQLVFYKCKQQHVPKQTKPVKLLFEIFYKRQARHDPDNGLIKPLCDGLVHAGVLADDSTKQIKEVAIKMHIGQECDKVIINII